MLRPPPAFPHGHMRHSVDLIQTFFDAEDCIDETPAELKITPSTPGFPHSPFLSGCSSPHSMYAGEDYVEVEPFPEYPLRSLSDPMVFRSTSEEPFQNSKPIRYNFLRI